MAYTFKNAVDDYNAENRTNYTEAEMLAKLSRGFTLDRLRTKRYREVDATIKDELEAE